MTISIPTREHIPALRMLWKEAFRDTDSYLDTFFSTAFSFDRCRMILKDGQVAAALYWFDCSLEKEKLAYLYAIATGFTFRGQGLCHALMEETSAQLRQQGYAGTLLVPGSPALFRFYEKMGYKTFGYLQEFSCSAAGYPVNIVPVSTEEYGRLRPFFLPAGGILQEKENLRLLEKEARFFKGDTFLLAARRIENRLYGLELLGDTSAAPGILCALNCTQGIFRTPGKERHQPFAMYRSLETEENSFSANKKGRIAPAYFGFAFD